MNTLLRYNSNSKIFFDQELGPFMKSRNVSQEARDYVRRHMIATRTYHSTNKFKHKKFLEERIKNSPYLTSLIIRLYHNDYKMFNFTLPTVNKS
jgi:hypothetical protein